MSDFSDWLQNNWIDLARLGVQTAILVAVLKYGRTLLAALRASQEQIGALLKLSMAESAHLRETEREPEPQPQSDFGRERILVPPPDRTSERAPEHTSWREPARQPIWDPEPQPEPAFAGPASMRDSYSEREHSLGGHVVGSPMIASPAMSTSTAVLDPPVAHNEPLSRGEAPVPRSEVRSFTPWVSAPAVGPDANSDLAGAPVAASPRQASAVKSWLNAPIRRDSGPGPIKKMVRWLKAPVRTPHPRPAR